MSKEFLKEDIKILKLGDPLYPSLLKKIAQPPKILYFRGQFLKNEKCLALVGTRRASDYGKNFAFSLAYELARAGLTIVSGLARGIDSFSHQGALEAKGRTIAILAGGLDEKSIYPRENLKLAQKILKNRGCLISEYPPQTPARREHFPQRNRLISGISLGVLVIEAPLKSGALITARWAQAQKRKIFALPGSVWSQNSQGPHLLIKKGGVLIERAEDILKELGFSQKEKEKISARTREENLILKILREKPLSIEEIIEKTNLETSLVSATLSLLEIEGKVKNISGNLYIVI